MTAWKTVQNSVILSDKMLKNSLRMTLLLLPNIIQVLGRAKQ